MLSVPLTTLSLSLLQHSQFISFPIKLFSPKKDPKKVVDDEATQRKQEAADKKAKEEGKEEPAAKVWVPIAVVVLLVEHCPGHTTSCNFTFKVCVCLCHLSPPAIHLKVEPVMKTIYEESWDWRLENENKPIWVRNPKDVSDENYNDFFKTTFSEFLDPLAHVHFNVEVKECAL